MTLYDFNIHRLNGQPFDLAQYKGKKVVVVNVASECGLTPQYTELEYLSREYSNKGVAVIGVPCNDFGGQEPGTAEQIQTFCSTTYDVTFPLTEKIHTVGADIHPLYQWLTAETGNEVTWNFQKFLINADGKVVKSLAPEITPTDPQLTDWLDHGN